MRVPGCQLTKNIAKKALFRIKLETFFLRFQTSCPVVTTKFIAVSGHKVENHGSQWQPSSHKSNTLGI